MTLPCQRHDWGPSELCQQCAMVQVRRHSTVSGSSQLPAGYSAQLPALVNASTRQLASRGGNVMRTHSAAATMQMPGH